MKKDRYLDPLKFDIRFIERNRRTNEVDETAVTKHIEELPDLAAEARWLDFDGSVCSEERSAELMQIHVDGVKQLVERKVEG